MNTGTAIHSTPVSPSSLTELPNMPADSDLLNHGEWSTDDSKNGIIAAAGHCAHSSSTHYAHIAMMTFVRDLLETPGTQVNIERTARRLRLRFKIHDPETGKRVRRALELPNDDRLAASLNDTIRSHRQAHREERGLSRGSRLRAEQRWCMTTRRRLLAACPHGRTVKRRLVLVFDLAVALGYVFLKDFLERRPWLVKSPFRAGRRCKYR